MSAPGVIVAGGSPCVPGPYSDIYKTVDTYLGNSVNISFGGVPPYNFTTSMYDPALNLHSCSEPIILNQSWYMWTVEPVIANASRQGAFVEQHQFQVPGDEVFLHAAELNVADGRQRYFSTDKYKIRTGVSGSGTSTSIPTALLLAALLVLPALLSL